jgi:hypothetical protein
MRKLVSHNQKRHLSDANAIPGVGKTMDMNLEEMKAELDSKFALFGPKQGDETAEKVLELVNREDFRAASGGVAGMIKVHPSGILGTMPIEPRAPISREEPPKESAP